MNVHGLRPGKLPDACSAHANHIDALQVQRVTRALLRIPDAFEIR